MASRRKKSQEIIKETLSISTENNFAVSYGTGSSKSLTKGRDLELTPMADSKSGNRNTSTNLKNPPMSRASVRSRVNPATRTRHKISYTIPKKQNHGAGLRAVFSAAILILLVGVGFKYNKQFKLFRKSSKSITINVEPKVFNLNDGRKYYRNVKSPFTLPIRKGSYSIIISRNGYKSKKNSCRK